MVRRRRNLNLVLVVLSTCACGGGHSSPTAPGSSPLTPSDVSVSVTNGILQTPIAGASILVEGRPFGPTPSSGALTISVASGTQLTVDGRQAAVPCPLPRETRWIGDSIFRLWCQDPGFIQQIVYGDTGGQGFLATPTGNVTIAIDSPEINADAARDAASWLDLATAGSRTWTVDGKDPVVVRISYNFDDAYIAANRSTVAGYARWHRTSAGWIDSGVIVIGVIYERRNMANLLAHELGHTFGLGHHTSVGPMNPATSYSVNGFSEDERRAIQMMIIRTSGTRPSIGEVFPDNDQTFHNF